MGKVFFIHRARRRRLTARCAWATLALAAVAVIATPDIATSIAGKPQRQALTDVSYATPAQDIERDVSLPRGTAVKDCADFDSQAEARAFMADTGGRDTHRLDGDGIACDRLR